MAQDKDFPICRRACSSRAGKSTDYASSRAESLIPKNTPVVYYVCALDNGGLATLIATQVGFGGTLGFLLGFGLKKVAAIILKILALVTGLFTLGLAWLASIGVISLNFNAFSTTMGSAFEGAVAALVGSLTLVAQVLPMGGSFSLGFYLGAKKG